MNTKILMVAIAVLSIGIAGTTATLSNVVYAKGTTPNGNDPNLFGKGASDLGKGGEMGDHASNQESPRHGIGNAGPDLGLTCGSKHPADLANALTGGSHSCNP